MIKNTYYDLHLVRTKGLKSMLYRFLTNSFWDKLVFRTPYDFYVVLDHKGLVYLPEKEFFKKYKVVETRRCGSYFIYSPVGLERLKENRNIRKCSYQTVKYFINLVINLVGKFLKIEKMKSFNFKLDEDRTNEVGFIIRMFGMKNNINEFTKDVKFFQFNDIYRFLDIDEYQVEESDITQKFKQNFMKL